MILRRICICRRPRAMLALVTLLGAGSAAQAQEACGTYVVKQGDTLGEIALAAYGALNYQLLFNANVEALRDSPSVPTAGTTLRIPCADGRLLATDDIPQITEVTAPLETAPARPEPRSDVAASYRPEIRIVSGDDWIPFADPKLTGGGIFLRISTTALDRAGPKYRHMIGWVEDWESHIFALLPTGGFDLATGWYDPDCENIATTSERTQYMCDNFLFSDPIYDSLFGFFAKADNPYAKAATFADLTGARICRAEGNLFHDLEAEGLQEPVVTLHMEDEEGFCLEGLLEDRYDIASFEVQYASVIFAELGITDEIVQSASLTSIQSSVAIAHRSNPRARDYIDHLNLGLAMLRDTDEWTEIVTSSLTEASEIEATE